MDPAATPHPSEARNPCFLAGLAVVLASAAALYLTGLGWTDLWAPDEPRYAAIAEELRSMRHGLRGLFLLHLNDAVYTQKPPLWFWLAALAGGPEGRVDEVAARLPSALAALASLGLTAWIGRALRLSSRTVLIATAVLATSYRFVFVARRAQLDGVLTAFLLVAIALFLWLDRDGSARRPAWVIATLHLALGAGALTKGPVAWLPLAVFAAFLAWEGRLPDLRRITPAWAFTLSAGPLVLWAGLAVAIAPPGYFDVAIVDNVLGRFFAGTSHPRPFFYFVGQLPIEFLPWSIALPLGLIWLHRASKKTSADPSRAWTARFLICWIGVPFLFFSLSAGKRGLYLLPILPALSIATAAGLDRALRRRRTDPVGLDRRLIAGIAGVALADAVLFLGIGPLVLDAHKSPRPIASGARTEIRPGEVLGVYRLPPLEPALTYYGAGPVVPIADESALAAFLEARRGPVVLRTRDLAALSDAVPLTEIAGFRDGARALSLVRRPRRTAPRDIPLSVPDSPRLGSAERTRPPYALAIPSFSGVPALPRGTHLRYSARGPDPR